MEAGFRCLFVAAVAVALGRSRDYSLTDQKKLEETIGVNDLHGYFCLHEHDDGNERLDGLSVGLIVFLTVSLSRCFLDVTGWLTAAFTCSVSESVEENRTSVFLGSRLLGKVFRTLCHSWFDSGYSSDVSPSVSQWIHAHH